MAIAQPALGVIYGHRTFFHCLSDLSPLRIISGIRKVKSKMKINVDIFIEPRIISFDLSTINLMMC
jgi:hypothetical protein